MQSAWLLAGYALVLLLLVPVILLLRRWGHLIFYLLEYLHIKLLAWWFVRQRLTVVDMFQVQQPQHRIARMTPAVLPPRLALPVSACHRVSVPRVPLAFLRVPGVRRLVLHVRCRGLAV